MMRRPEGAVLGIDIWGLGVMLLAPVAVTVSVPVPTLEVPRMIAFASTTATLLLPLLLSETAAWKSFVA